MRDHDDDPLDRIANSLAEITEILRTLAVPQRYVLNNCVEPNAVDEATVAAIRRSAQTTQRLR